MKAACEAHLLSPVLADAFQVGSEIKTPGSEKTARPGTPSPEFISTVNIACK